MDAVMSWADHPVVDVRPDDRILRRRIGRALRLGFALTRIWWPLWLPITILDVAGLPLVAAAALTATAAGIGVWKVERVRARLRGAPLASAGAVFRYQWPKLCAQTGITAVVDGSLRCPRLVKVTLGGPWWRFWQLAWARLEVEPLGIQDEEIWPKMGRRIARQLHFATVTSLAADEVLEIHLYRGRLPKEIRLGRDVPLAALTPEPGVVAVGESSLGGPIPWCWDQPTRTSIALTGGTGGGKGDFINKVLLGCRNLIEAGEHVEVIVLDPKGLGDFNWASSFALVLQDTVAMCRALAHVRAEMDRRREFMNRRDAASWTDLEPADQQLLGRLVLIVDEFVSLANRTAEVTLPDDPTFKGKNGGGRVVNLMPQALTDLQEITATARAMRTNVLVATQHFIADTVPGKFGSTIIANLGARVGLGSMEVGGAATLFGKAHAESVASRSRAKIPGRMIYASLSDDASEHGPITGQGWWAHPTLLRQLRPTNPIVEHRDVMADPDRTPIGAEDLTARPADPGEVDEDLAAELHQLNTDHYHPTPPAPADTNHHDPSTDHQPDTAPIAVIVNDDQAVPEVAEPEVDDELAEVDDVEDLEPAPDGLTSGARLGGGVILGRLHRSPPVRGDWSWITPTLTAVAGVLAAVALLGVAYLTLAGLWLWTHGGVR